MSGSNPTVEELSQAHLVAWQSGQPRRLESMLSLIEPTQYSRLLRALLLVELRFRRQQGEDPSLEDYESRFPCDSATVREVFELIPAHKPAIRTDKTPARKKPREKGQPLEVIEDVEILEDDPELEDDLDFAEKPAHSSKSSRDRTARSKSSSGRSSSSSGRDSISKRSSRSVKSSAKSDDPEEDVEEWDEWDLEKLSPPPKRKKRASSDDQESKGKKKTKKSSKRRSIDPQMITEWIAPLALTIVGLILTVVLAFVQSRGHGADLSLGAYWLLFKLGYAGFSTITTVIALFIAAAFFEMAYGDFGPAVLKVSAVCLTQIWLDMAFEIPGNIAVEWVGAIVVSVVVLGMFMWLFSLDIAEALRSMFVVRMVQRVVFGMLLAGFLTAAFSGAFRGHTPNGPGDVDPDVQAEQMDPGHMSDEDADDM